MCNGGAKTWWWWELAFASGFGHRWRAGWLHCNAQCHRAGQTDSTDGQPGKLWLQDLVESWGHLPCVMQQMKPKWLLQEISGHIKHATQNCRFWQWLHVCGSCALGGWVSHAGRGHGPLLSCLCPGVSGGAEPPHPAALCPLVREGVDEEPALISQPPWGTGQSCALRKRGYGEMAH